MPNPLNIAGQPGPDEPHASAAPRQLPLEVEVKTRRELATALPAWDLVPPDQLLSRRRRGP